jgi:hypothetical protein
MPTIRIDDEVWHALKAQAEPFVDTPNDVLRRILLSRASERIPHQQVKLARDEFPVQNHDLTRNVQEDPRKRRGPRARVDRTPESAFRIPILQALVELEGRSSVFEILKRVGRSLEGTLKPDDFKTLKSGEIRWENTAKWERKHLIDDGLLESNSRHGVWAMTSRGRKHLEEHSTIP